MDGLNDRYCAYLYWTWKDTPGWLSKLKDWKLVDEKEFEYLEEIDEAYSPTDIKVKKWEKEIRDNGNEIYFMDEIERKVVEEKIKNECLKKVKEMIERNTNYLDIKVFMIQNGIKFEKKKKNFNSSKLTQDEINKAKSYPLENLVGKSKYILCPFHKDNKPSLYVKNGFGYCFSCNEKVDSIRWVMHNNNVGFIEAVKILS